MKSAIAQAIPSPVTGFSEKFSGLSLPPFPDSDSFPDSDPFPDSDSFPDSDPFPDSYPFPSIFVAITPYWLKCVVSKMIYPSFTVAGKVSFISPSLM